MGTGINKITSLLMENGNFDPIFEFDSFYNLTLRRNGGVNGSKELLLRIITKTPGKRINKLTQIIKTPQRTVERWIKKLKDENKIYFKGSSKTGGYFTKGFE